MKTITIRPELLGFDNTYLRDPRKPLNKTVAFCLALIPVVALAGWAAGHFTGAPLTQAPAVITSGPARLDEPVPVVPAGPAAFSEGAVELQTAVEQGLVRAEFSGNGREELKATISHSGAASLTVKVSFGQTLESARNLVVVARNGEVEIPAGQSATLELHTLAVRSANRVAAGTYLLSVKTVPQLDLLLAYAQDHPELSPGALQTAALALTENLPLSAVCKFTPGGADLPSRFETSAFRVETAHIVSALAVLREIGVKDRNLALTVDPQLKVEAMIEPASRAPAMRYYGISAASEWEFWKGQLLSGQTNTRHYALFGIARFYPEVALDMLPKWAREKRTASVLRLAAVQALAETQRAEALPVLHQLVKELGHNTELGRAARDAALYLDSHLSKIATTQAVVAFRNTSATAPF